jgi:hypothetical protein
LLLRLRRRLLLPKRGARQRIQRRVVEVLAFVVDPAFRREVEHAAAARADLSVRHDQPPIPP